MIDWLSTFFMKPKVYIETTVVSYLTARPSRDLVIAAHCEITREWWIRRRSEFDLHASQLVLQESSAGDPQMAEKRPEALDSIPLLDITDDATALAEKLIDAGPIPAKAAVDALHIATATVHGVDYLLTWTCKHIANAQMRKSLAVRCRAAGFELPVICTPEELLEE